MTRMQARFNGVVIADSDQTIVVEGNHYFPSESVPAEHLVASATHTVCPWKGSASYYSVTAGGSTSTDAAWYYPEPKPAARQVAGRIAFWRDVTVAPAPAEEPGSPR